jgi:hypothetical protein
MSTRSPQVPAPERGRDVLGNVRLNPANAHIDASPAALITKPSMHNRC